MKYLLTTMVWLFLLGGMLPAQDERPVSDIFNEKLAVMLGDDAGKAQTAQQEWQKHCLQWGAPGQEAKRAEAVRLMTEALPKTEKDDVLKWFIRQLGYIGDAGCVEAIGRCIDHKNSTVMEIAIWSLGTIPNNEAGRILEKWLETEKREIRTRSLRTAIDFRKARQAVTLPKLDEVLKTLESHDKAAWDAALPAVGWLHDVKITEVPNYRARFNKLDPAAKVLLMDALTDARDRSALPLAMTLSNENDETLKLAGLRALGPIGNVTVIPVLLKNIKGQTDVGRTARDSLRRLNYDGADEALIAAFEREQDIETKCELIDVLRSRRVAVAVPLFEEGIRSSTAEIRNKSIYALETVGEPTSLPALVEKFFHCEDSGVREAIERAIVRINTQLSDKDGRGVVLCEEIEKRPLGEQARLLPLLGRIGGTAAFAFVRKSMSIPALSDEAFDTLYNWTDAAAADTIYLVAAKEDHPSAAKAIRAYIRVVTLRAEGRSAKDSLKLFEKAMALAKTDDDRRFLLTRVETARSMEVFRFVVPYLDNPELEQAACRAVVDLANDHWFYMHNRKKIDPVLDKVIEKSKDKNHVDRAKRYKERR